MEDWIARAINPAKNHTQKDAAVEKDALRCNRWIASSALQKSVRRGDVALAERAAFALHREDCSAIWRRLIAIAFEDVGPADLDVFARGCRHVDPRQPRREQPPRLPE